MFTNSKQMKLFVMWVTIKRLSPNFAFKIKWIYANSLTFSSPEMKSHNLNLVTDLIILVVNMVLSLKFPKHVGGGRPLRRSDRSWGEAGGGNCLGSISFGLLAESSSSIPINSLSGNNNQKTKSLGKYWWTLSAFH